MNSGDLNWASGMAGAVIGAMSAIGVAMINGRSSLNQTIDNRIKTILQDDEATIKRLESEVFNLRRYVTLLISVMMKSGLEVPTDPAHETMDEEVGQ